MPWEDSIEAILGLSFINNNNILYAPLHCFFVSRRRSSFYKFLSSLLIASFLLPASVMAQVAGTSTSEDNTQSATTSTEGGSPLGQILSGIGDMFTGDGGKPEDGKPDGGDGGGELGPLSGGDDVPYDGTRDAAGSRLPLGASLDLSGAFRYSYPLIIPPGRKGLAPKLSLEYSSQSNENQSIFGYGWSDNIPFIQRFNKMGTEDLYTRYDFVSSYDGELLPTTLSTTTSFSAKNNNGDFRTYTFQNNAWTVTDKQGTVYKFGTSTGSRQYDTGTSTTRIFKWMLDEVRDTNGNYIKYTYYQDAGQIYPSTIVYTGNGSTDGIFEISFLRETRTDNATTSLPAFTVKTNYRINEIQAKVNGSWVKKYVLLYTTGDNGARSLLQTIRETGKDEDGNTITLPDTTFLARTSPKQWANDTGWVPPVSFGLSNTYDTGSRLADVNGDGLPDVLLATSGTSAVYTNTGAGWTASTTWQIPSGFLFAANGVGRGNVTFDVNGDGLADLVKTENTATRKIYINNGSGWTESTTWSWPIDNRIDAEIQIADVNGDGLTDILRSQYSSDEGGNPGIHKTYINTGSSWVHDTTWTAPVSFGLGSSYDRGVRLADVNGDGLVDFLLAFSDGTGNAQAVYINTGTNWTQATTWQIPSEFYFATNGVGNGNVTFDINGDGLADLAKTANGSTRKIYINTGTGWTEDTTWSWPVDGPLNLEVRLADADGDGMTDVLHSVWNEDEGGNPGCCPHKTYVNHHERADLLQQLTKSTGSKTTAIYKTTPLYKSGSTLLNPKLPLVLDTVEAIGTDDGFSAIATTTYSYEGGEYYFASSTDRQFAGFGKIIKSDSAGNKTTTFYHQGNASDSALGENSDHIAKAGKAYRVEEANSSGNLYKKTVTRWGRFDQGNGRSFVRPIQTQVSDYDGNAGAKSKGEAYTFSDTNGNLTQKIEYGEVTGSDNGLFSDTGTDKFTTDISYASGGSVIGLPSTETTNNQSSVKVKESRHYYDSQSLGSVTKGNETKTEGWKTSSSYASTTKSYDGTYGLVTQEKDGKANATTYSYDSYNLFVATSTNPLSHTRAFQYDYSSGKVKELVDENNRKFVTTYDALDRVKEEKQPDITTPSTLVTKAAYTYTDTVGSRKVQKSHYLDASNIVDEYTYLDGLDRVIQKRREAEDANTFAVSDFTYNTRGLLEKESLPYFSTGSSRTTATTTSALFTTYAYDPLQRISTTTRVVGNEIRAYDDWKTTITDPRNNQKALYADAHGNLIKVDEVNGGSTYTTNYEYNYLKNLTKVTDADGNLRNFTYDGLGRRLTAQDLHASADGTYGTWTYTYDDAGNMTQKVDPKSQTMNYTYDALNRVTSEDYTGAAGTEATYSYDSGTDGKTRLTQAVFTGSATTDYTYHPLGLTKTETTAITGGATYTTTHDYDRQGNQTLITYPDSAQVRYTYNNGGLLEKVEEMEGSVLILLGL
jgi:YD repeat-containing protein